MKNFELMFDDTECSDFKIICKGRELSAHKFVLIAQCPVFSAMLEPHTKEAQTGQVEYADIDYEVGVFMQFTEKYGENIIKF